ncbi:MAG: hypothetical protein IJB79_06635 [Candidatus Gastranaerophilales bacterium]|nr:hypothetical protein [Candidatus Gastranaerophilales bacterium]
MKPTQLDAFKTKTKTQILRTSHPQNDTIKGVLLNNHIKKDSFERIEDFDRISNELLIPNKLEMLKEEQKKEKKESFDYKKALKPAAIAAAAMLGGMLAISLGVKKYSNVMANKSDIVRPGDLARNINILEEPHFAAYRMLRDPNAKNVAGFIGVCLMSAVTLVAKNFIDASKEIWIKKQNCDIEYDLQENLIEVEAEAFKGKLNIVNTLLSDTTKYFKETLSSQKTDSKPNFKSYLSFKGSKKEENTKEKNINPKTIFAIGAGVLSFVGISFALFKNYQKTLKNLDIFVQKYEHNEISAKIINAINNDDKETAIKELKDIFKVINATNKTMEDNFSKINGISTEEIQKAIREVSEAQIYAQAPEALGGISEKIQYYCYINEERGHLYNWILNPENKFNEYLFLCFSAISSIGYIGKQAADAIREVIVNKENSKSELGLKKRLVETEINNFKTKKLSAVNPHIDTFIHQLEQGKPKEELKQMAENILIEIKNGPPYVYS